MRTAHLCRATDQDIWQRKRVRALAANGGDFHITPRGNNVIFQEIKEHVLVIQVGSELPSGIALSVQVLRLLLLLYLAPILPLVIVLLLLLGIRRPLVPGGSLGDHLARCEQLTLRSRVVTHWQGMKGLINFVACTAAYTRARAASAARAPVARRGGSVTPESLYSSRIRHLTSVKSHQHVVVATAAGAPPGASPTTSTQVRVLPCQGRGISKLKGAEFLPCILNY